MKKRLLEMVPIIIISLLTFLWYQNNHWSVLMGDDLIAVTGYKEFGFWGNLFNAADISMGKIRPIQKVLLYLVYLIGGIEYKRYYVVTRIFIVIAAIVVYKVSRQLKIDNTKAIIIAALMITCPFSAYGAWQYIGVSESFYIICSILYGYYTYKYLYSEELQEGYKYIAISALWFGILVFGAERFMYIVAVQILVILLKKNVMWKQKVIHICIAISPIIFRSILLNILGSNSLGTGRSDIWTLLSTLIPYAVKGFINMLGFAIGDNWHGGFELLQISPFIIILSSIRIFIFLGILFDSVKNAFINDIIEFKEIVVWFLFSLTSLFSYALVASTHGEDRFLWISYMFYLIAAGRYVKQIKCMNLLKIKLSENVRKNCLGGTTAIVTMCLIASNYYYLENKTGVHFRYSQEMAETAIESIKELENNQDVKNVAFVNPNDYSWVFYGNSFVHFYVNENVNAYFYNTIDELNANKELLGEYTVVIYPDLEHAVPKGARAYWINDFKEE